jgi:hypothetical protein
MAGKKKVPERRSGLRPSEKQLPERRSVIKIPLLVTMAGGDRTPPSCLLFYEKVES